MKEILYYNVFCKHLSICWFLKMFFSPCIQSKSQMLFLFHYGKDATIFRIRKWILNLNDVTNRWSTCFLSQAACHWHFHTWNHILKETRYNLLRVQFHQHFMLEFLYKNQILDLFSNCSSALWLFGERISAKKACVKCWWNWP